MTSRTPSFRDLPPADLLRRLFDAAVQRALPLHTLAAHLPPPPKGRTVVIGAGKAGGAMAQAVEALWPADAPLSGLVVTRYDHIPPRPDGLPRRIEVVEASHPVPDEAGMAAAGRILQAVQGLTEDDLVLCLISGGGSALLTLPCDGLTLQDKQRINRELLECGAHIGEMNTVRKHLSRIKGGRLAALCAPARMITLTISDVPGDDPSVIASGPTVPDATTCADALAILDRYRIGLPPAVRAQLAGGEERRKHAGDLRIGQPADWSVEGVSQPSRARVARINPTVQTGSRSLLAYLTVPAQEGLRQGLFVQGQIETGQLRAVAVPLSALRSDQPQPYLQLLQDGQVVHRQVVPGQQGQVGGETLVAIDGLVRKFVNSAATQA